MRIILASASPRRKELFQKLFPVFEIIPAQSEEVSLAASPEETVLELAAQKAEEVSRLLEGTKDYLIAGADTVVSWQGEILGKPKHEKDAQRMLRMLSGNTHQVYTGVTLMYVKFYPVLEAEIKAYIKTGEPMDKAGSYGIQGLGGRFVERIEGDYENVVGLPVSKIYQVLKKIDDFSLPF